MRIAQQPGLGDGHGLGVPGVSKEVSAKVGELGEVLIVGIVRGGEGDCIAQRQLCGVQRP
jgi:hypothetical protein